MPVLLVQTFRAAVKSQLSPLSGRSRRMNLKWDNSLGIRNSVTNLKPFCWHGQWWKV